MVRFDGFMRFELLGHFIEIGEKKFDPKTLEKRRIKKPNVMLSDLIRICEPIKECGKIRRKDDRKGTVLWYEDE